MPLTELKAKPTFLYGTAWKEVETRRLVELALQNGARRAWDADVRAFCAKHEMTYQGFSLLRANPEVLQGTKVKQIAARLKRTASQVVFRFALQVGMLPLTGTTDPAHMREDLEVLNFALEEEDVAAIGG